MVMGHAMPSIMKIDELNFKSSKIGQAAPHMRGLSNEYSNHTKPGYCLL
jgi:hypothetical protein